MKEQMLFRSKHKKLISDLKREQGEEPGIIATPRPRKARIGSTLPNKYGAGLAGAAPRSRVGSAALYISTVTLISIQ